MQNQSKWQFLGQIQDTVFYYTDGRLIAHFYGFDWGMDYFRSVDEARAYLEKYKIEICK